MTTCVDIKTVTVIVLEMWIYNYYNFANMNNDEMFSNVFFLLQGACQW